MPTPTLGSDICMTLLTQLRSLFVEQGCMVRTMHPVAQRAIFTDGIMLPQEGATFLRMAAITVFVNLNCFKD